MGGPDVVVVGGGITGLGVARDLAMRGAAVTVVERESLGSGATGHSHGLLHSGARYADTEPEAAKDCHEESRILRRIAPGCVRETGGYVVSVTDDSAAYFERKLTACRRCGVDAEELSVDDAREREPCLSPAVERIAAVPDAAISPRRLVAATAEAAGRHGARLLTRTAVVGARTRGDLVTGVKVEGSGNHEWLPADHVVNAAGAWAGRVAGRLGVEVRMRPTRGVMVAVEHELGTVLNRSRPPTDGDIVVPAGSNAVLGTTSEPVEDPDAYTGAADAAERVIEECAAMCPALAQAPVARRYWGVRPLFAPGDQPGASGRDLGRGFAILDHADRDGVAGLTTVVGGKLTTYRLMAEAAADAVAQRLGLDALCRTAEVSLPGADPATLDSYADALGVQSPAG